MKKVRVIQFLIYFFGICSMLYCLALNICVSFTNVFHYFFLVAGIILFIFGKIFKRIRMGKIHLPKWLICIGCVLTLLCFICFGVIEGVIIHAAVSTAPKNLSYIIVLGAGLNGEKPSLTLTYRLDKSYEYLMANPDAKVIVSGGQGFDEPITEALAMERYLIEKGIDRERILREDASTSTYENLKFSKELLKMRGEDITSLKVGIVSNDFHIYRALYLARELSYNEVYGCSAKSVIWLKPNNYIREAFAVIKDCVF